MACGQTQNRAAPRGADPGRYSIVNGPLQYSQWVARVRVYGSSGFTGRARR